MLALTRPSFLQLLVAVVAGLTAGYAAVRRQGEMLAGAVVAAALLPSLTVVGFGAATMNGVVFVGALALFLTGLVVILFCSAFVAKLYGFASFGEKPTPLQTIAVMTVLLVLSLPLAMALRQVALESATTRQAREIIVQYFGDDARLSRLEMDFTSEPTVARATVQAIHRRLDADRQIGERLTAAVGRPVTAQVSQVLVDGAASRRERERQELEAAKKEEGESLKRANEAEAEVIAGELSVIGASTPDAVIVDRIGRRASLSAEPAPGVLLPAWRELETRVAKRHPGWSIIVLPPMAPLPLVPFADGSDSLSREGLEAVADAAWALSRWGIKSAVVNGRVASGESETADGLNELARARAEAVKKALAERGIMIASRTSTSGSIQRAAEARYGRGTLRSVEILPDTGDRGVRAAR
jgi:outer membrane protein OmpA-like peptidoglycan-associated protein